MESYGNFRIAARGGGLPVDQAIITQDKADELLRLLTALHNACATILPSASCLPPSSSPRPKVLARIPGAELDLAAEVLIRVTEIAPTPAALPPPRAHIPQGRPAAETPAERTVVGGRGDGADRASRPGLHPPAARQREADDVQGQAPKPVAGVVLLKAQGSVWSDRFADRLSRAAPRSTVQAICGGAYPKRSTPGSVALKTAIAQQQEQLSQAAAII